MPKQYTNALFISDLHLTEDRPECIRAFFDFLSQIPSSTEALFILGDFFDYWVGDDVQTELSKSIALAISKAKTDKNLDIYFLPGNRDFSIGPRFCSESSMALIKDNQCFRIGDQKVLVSHGDLFCTDDRSYQLFRKIIRNPVVLFLLLKLSKKRRLGIAQKLRAQSKRKYEKSQTIVDVNTRAIEGICQTHNPDIIVHGHTHIADIHYHKNDQFNVTRMVLGDWHRVGWFGSVDEKEPKLTRFEI